MDLDQILIPCRDQAVTLKMLGDVIRDLVLVQISVSSVNKKLCVVTIGELIVLGVY
jgi:hypothetical protein